MKNAESPAAYIAALTGWHLRHATALRRAVKKVSRLDERVKWGHLVYYCNGPVCLIRAEEHRVILGFWRGRRLRHIEDRLQAGGKYEMARLELTEATSIEPRIVRTLVEEAVELNASHGDPTDLAPTAGVSTSKVSRRR